MDGIRLVVGASYLVAGVIALAVAATYPRLRARFPPNTRYEPWQARVIIGAWGSLGLVMGIIFVIDGLWGL